MLSDDLILMHLAETIETGQTHGCHELVLADRMEEAGDPRAIFFRRFGADGPAPRSLGSVWCSAVTSPKTRLRLSLVCPSRNAPFSIESIEVSVMVEHSPTAVQEWRALVPFAEAQCLRGLFAESDRREARSRARWWSGSGHVPADFYEQFFEG